MRGQRSGEDLLGQRIEVETVRSGRVQVEAMACVAKMAGDEDLMGLSEEASCRTIAGCVANVGRSRNPHNYNAQPKILKRYPYENGHSIIPTSTACQAPAHPFVLPTASVLNEHP